jgi:DNA (cytosine-5)-methyltransferase 1
MSGIRPAPLTALDVFSGAGGFSLGLERAGFRSVGAIEIDSVASKTYETNFGRRAVMRVGPMEGNARRIAPGDLGDELGRAGIQQLDLLVAGPPCQGFSRVGRGKLDFIKDRAGAFVLDGRNHLYRQAVAIAAELRPRAFVFENVAGILHVRGRNVAERVCEAVAEVGYDVRCALLNAAWYGVPQSRERLFIVAVRSDLGVAPRFPARRHSVEVTRGHLSQADMDPANWNAPSFFMTFDDLPVASRLRPPVTVRQAFSDLPTFTGHLKALRSGAKYRPRREEMPAQEYRRAPRNAFARLMRAWPGLSEPELVTDHYCRWTPRDFETFRRMRANDRYTRALEIAHERYFEARLLWELRAGPFPKRAQFIPPYPDHCFDEKWRKLGRDQPSHTITAHLGKDTYSHIHPSAREARAITPREAARLQSFPDGFEFEGNMGDMFRQIGNAVPPLLASAVGEALADLLRDADRAKKGECSNAPVARRSASGM